MSDESVVERMARETWNGVERRTTHPQFIDFVISYRELLDVPERRKNWPPRSGKAETGERNG